MFATLSTTRRDFLTGSATAAAALAFPRAMVAAQGRAASDSTAPRQALVAITLDLEMSRNFPRWGDTHWDYEKGNLNEPTKAYTVEACRRVKAAGGVLHTFLVAQALEQENIDWLREIIAAGHPIGSHTYDHINVYAKTLDEVQWRFRRAPWLVAGKSPRQAIADNIHLANLAFERHLGIKPAGFRTPGGFDTGLRDRVDLQQLVLDAGFSWVSSLYPLHEYGTPGKPPTESVTQSILAAQPKAQPLRYPSGLVEVPMNPISDLGAFRVGRWPLESLLTVLRDALEWTIERGAVFDFLGHPSCLYVVDPEFRVIDLICRLVREAGPRAKLVGLDSIAERVAAPTSKPTDVSPASLR